MICRTAVEALAEEDFEVLAERGERCDAHEGQERDHDCAGVRQSGIKRGHKMHSSPRRAQQNAHHRRAARGKTFCQYLLILKYTNPCAPWACQRRARLPAANLMTLSQRKKKKMSCATHAAFGEGGAKSATHAPSSRRASHTLRERASAGDRQSKASCCWLSFPAGATLITH